MKTALTIAFLIVAGAVEAQNPSAPRTIKDVMTAQEVRATGLSKLTDAELEALTAWLARAFQMAAAQEGQPGTSAPAPRSTGSVSLREVVGGSIVADDGQQLGTIENCFASESICNEFGKHGSEFSSTSILNEFSPYGSEFSRLSAFDGFTTTPPLIFKNGRFIAYLTVNQSLSPRVDPHALLAALK